MPDLDTDPNMMRHQQDLDVPEEIEDAALSRRNKSDSDPQSASDRKASESDRPFHGREQKDAILSENREAADHPTDRRGASSSAKSDDRGLVQPGRSRLGN